MTTLVPFTPTAISAFSFQATLDGSLYQVLVTWNLYSQGWFINILDADNALVLCEPAVGSPPQISLALQPLDETVASMSWSSSAGGTVTFVMAAPSSVKLGDTIVVSGATNTGTGGAAAVNVTYVVNSWADSQHFTAALTAAPGVVGTIGGSPVLVLQQPSLTWSLGVVTAATPAPHNYPLGAIVRLVIDGVTPAAYNGRFYCYMTAPSEFKYQLTTDPGGPSTAVGSYSPDINLVDQYFSTSTLIYRPDQSRFEVRP